MERLVKDYGKEFKGIKELANDYQTMILQTGAVSDLVKKELKELTEKCMFEPKSLARLSFLEGKGNNTTEELAEIKNLRETQTEAQNLFCAKTLADDIKELIGEGKTISLLRREKVMMINRKKEIRDMSYLPKGVMFLQDPLNNAGKDEVHFPTSVFRVQLKEDEAEVTGEKIVVLGFLSLCFDPYKKYYEVHHWRVYFKVVDKEEVIAVEEESVEEDLL